MSKARRWRSGTLVAASVLAHAGVLAILAANRPQPQLYEAPEVFEMTIAPRVITTPQEVTRPRQLLRPRPSRSRPDDLSVAPLVVPQAQAPALPAPTPPSLTPQLSAALRRGLGCAHIATLSPDERDRCLERLGAGAGEVTPLPLGTPAAKQKGFDTAAAHKEACRRYKEAAMPPGLSAPSEVGMPSGLGSSPALRGGSC